MCDNGVCDDVALPFKLVFMVFVELPVGRANALFDIGLKAGVDIEALLAV